MSKRVLILVVSFLGCAAAHAVVVASFNPDHDDSAVSSNISFEDDLSGMQTHTASATTWDGREYGIALQAGVTADYNGDDNLYFGDSVYGDLTTVADNKEGRYRVRNATPNVFQLLSIVSASRSGVMVLEGGNAVLQDINLLTTTFDKDFNASVVVEVGGQLYISSTLHAGTGDVTDYALDLTGETWKVYSPAPLTNDTATVYALDFRFANASGAVAALNDTDVVTKIGLAYETTADGQGWSCSTMTFFDSTLDAGSSLELVPSGQLDIELMAPGTTAEGTVSASFTYGSTSNNVDVTSVTFSNLSHGAGSFTSLDSFPVNLTDPAPSNEILSIQFDNAVAGLSENESADGIALVSWTEVSSGTTNIVELPVGATYYPAMAVNWSGTEIVTEDINNPTRLDVVDGANAPLRWQAYGFDPAGDPLYTGMNPATLEFTGGVAVYSTNADTVVSMDRTRVADATPDDTIWFRSQNQDTNSVDYYDGVSIAAAYLWQPTESITLGDIIQVDTRFNNVGAPGEARMLLRTGGSQYISEPLGWTNTTSYTLSSVASLTWAAYVPGDLITDGGVTNLNVDMRFDTAVSGGFSALSASTAVDGIGIAADVQGAAASEDDASFNLGVFVVSITSGSGSSPYETWAGSFGLTNSPNADADFDYDLDGLDNLAEYGLGGNPTSNDAAAILPGSAVVNDAGTDWFYHIHNERTDDPSLTFTVQAISNLISGTWSTNGVEYVDETGESGGFKTVTNRTDVGSEEFIRLQIEQN